MYLTQRGGIKRSGGGCNCFAFVCFAFVISWDQMTKTVSSTG